VQDRLRLGAPLLDTAWTGALDVEFPADAPPRLVSRERERNRRYWRE
jgi:competence protein ComEC